jgi:hypothetical protein
MPANQWLSEDQNALKWAIVGRIERLGYRTEIFFDPRITAKGLASGKAWSASRADSVTRRCIGAAILGFPRWHVTQNSLPLPLPTEYNHYEAAIAYTMKLPLLVFVQQDVMRRCVFDGSYGPFIGVFPTNADQTWLESPEAEVTFHHWQIELEKRRDIFLGYCGSSAGTANNLKRFLEKEIGVTVLDWRSDFQPAGSILERIVEAADQCAAGIFLFTKDDPLPLLDPNAPAQAVPRDNVLFEAGYFVSSKGKSRVLIVLESGAKMPADLGGDIYAKLSDKSNIEPIEKTVRDFVTAL